MSAQMSDQPIFLAKTMPLKLGAQKTFKCFAIISIYCNGKLTFKSHLHLFYALIFYPNLTQIVQFVLS